MPKELPPLPLGTSEDHHDGSYKKYQRISYQVAQIPSLEQNQTYPPCGQK